MSRQGPRAAPEAVTTQANLSLAKPPASAMPASHEGWVDAVRLLAIFLIVLGHVANLDRRFTELPVGSAGWIEIDAVTSVIRWSLPVFVMISGYFLLDPGKNLDWRTYYHRRMRRIAWPLLVWTALYLGIGINDDLAAGRTVNAGMVASLVFRGEPYYHLWYLYMLPGLYMVCPFLRLATDRMSPNQLIGAVAMCFGVTVFAASMDGLYGVAHATYIDEFPRYLGYFLAGHLLGRVLPSAKLAPTAAVMVVAFLATAAVAYAVAEVASPSRALRTFGFGNPTIIVLSLAAFALLRRVRVASAWRVWTARAAETSFGIYLVHPAILNTLRYWTYPNSLAQFAAEVLLVFMASLIVVLAMQRVPVLRRCV